jgi:hypothetical protein
MKSRRSIRRFIVTTSHGDDETDGYYSHICATSIRVTVVENGEQSKRRETSCPAVGIDREEIRPCRGANEVSTIRPPCVPEVKNEHEQRRLFAIIWHRQLTPARPVRLKM